MSYEFQIPVFLKTGGIINFLKSGIFIYSRENFCGLIAGKKARDASAITAIGSGPYRIRFPVGPRIHVLAKRALMAFQTGGRIGIRENSLGLFWEINVTQFKRLA